MKAQLEHMHLMLPAIFSILDVLKAQVLKLELYMQNSIDLEMIQSSHNLQ